VDVANVERLNLLDLAPGGHLGRFVIWTESAFKKLDEVYSFLETPSLKKKGFVLPRPKMSNADLGRLINSDEVKSRKNHSRMPHQQGGQAHQQGGQAHGG
jgi:large subunit ribosomal protein L4e